MIEATDPEQAAQEALDYMGGVIAEEITVQEVLADAEVACEVLQDFGEGDNPNEIGNALFAPTYHELVEAGDAQSEDFDYARFENGEVPYIVNLTKYLCPAAAVRTNVV